MVEHLGVCDHVNTVHVSGIDGNSLQFRKPYELENTATQPICYVIGINAGIYHRYL